MIYKSEFLADEKVNLIEGNFKLDTAAKNIFRIKIDLLPSFNIYYPKVPANNVDSDCSNSSHKVKRRRKKQNCHKSIFLSVKQYESTLLDDVGLQMWTGGLLLAEYLLYHRLEFKDNIVVDLGAGLGFSGIILSLLNQSKAIIITDHKSEILDLAHENYLSNLHLRYSNYFQTHDSINNIRDDNILFEVLDWNDLDFDHRNIKVNGDKIGNFTSKYSSWKVIDEKYQLYESKIIFITSDVIYDDDITTSYFLKLDQLFHNNDILILTMEKRINYSLHLNQEVINGYDLFLAFINQNVNTNITIPDMKHRFIGEIIDVNSIPHSIQSYERSKYLEIWKIKIVS